jgi:fluoroquinolone resistance protein
MQNTLFDSIDSKECLNFENNNFFENKKLKALNFDNKIIKDKEFQNCNFVRCNFLECSFERCSFEECSFYNCNLSLVKLISSRFITVNFHNSKLVGINWVKAATPLDVNFFECIINNSNFLGLGLRNINIIKCEAKETNFADANLKNAKFTSTNLEKSRFLNTNLIQANFTDAINYSINPNQNQLKKTIFTLPEAISLLQNLDIILK